MKLQAKDVKSTISEEDRNIANYYTLLEEQNNELDN